MTRSADSTIKGFLYQFEKALFEILSNENENSAITVEGIEDVDIDSNGDTTFIQCKYHEKQEKYSISKIEKPIIFMLEDWCKRNQEGKIQYVLFCHFPNEEISTRTITYEQLKCWVNKKTPEKLKSHKSIIKKFITKNGETCIKEFVNRLKIEFSMPYESLVEKNHEYLEKNGCNNDMINEIFYPNAITLISKLSIKRLIEDRSITKKTFICKLKSIDKVILSKYTKYLKNYKQILTKKRKQLKEKLNMNMRKRYFVLDENSFEDFENTLVCFINEFLDKFQYKRSKLHINDKTIPTFILFSTIEEFKTIVKGLRSKNIKSNIGFQIDFEDWDEKDFFVEPVVNTKKAESDFRVRILQIDEANFKNRLSSLGKKTPEDLYIINTLKMNDVSWLGTDIENLDVENVKQLKYVLNMAGDYE